MNIEAVLIALFVSYALSSFLMHALLGFSSRRWYVVLGAIFPDFDYILQTDFGENLIFGHRGFFHWFGWLFMVPFIYKYCKGSTRDFIYGVVVCHLSIDLLNGHFFGVYFWSEDSIFVRSILILLLFISIFVYNWFFYRKTERQISLKQGLPCTDSCNPKSSNKK